MFNRVGRKEKLALVRNESVSEIEPHEEGEIIEGGRLYFRAQYLRIAECIFKLFKKLLYQVPSNMNLLVS